MVVDREDVGGAGGRSERSRVPIFLIGSGVIVCIVTLLLLDRIDSRIPDAVEEARAAGFILDVRRTRSVDSPAIRLASGCYAAFDRIRQDKQFEAIEKQWKTVSDKQVDPEKVSAMLELLQVSDLLFADLDRIQPAEPIDPTKLDELRVKTALSLHILSATAHAQFAIGDRARAERAIERLIAIATAFRGTFESWTTRFRLIALNEACKRMLEMLPRHPTPEAWVKEILLDDGTGAWSDYTECELTMLLEATDPTLVGATMLTRMTPQIEFRSLLDRIFWPENLGALVSIGARSRELVDAGAPDAYARICEMEKEEVVHVTWLLPSSIGVFSKIYLLELQARSDAALVRASANVLERVRQVGIESADLTALARDLPIDLETGLFFAVTRNDGGILIHNTTNSRSFRITSDALGGK